MCSSKVARRLAALVLPAVMLMGCSSPGISVNESQTVVMDSSVLTAGILASNPNISSGSTNLLAESTLSNSHDKPVKVNYRFYWYDAQGLDIRPRENPREIVVPANASVEIYSINHNFDAKSVRLHLFL